MAEKDPGYLKLASFFFKQSRVYERNSGYFNERILNQLNSFIL